MADNPTIDNGALADYVVSADEASSGQVQRVKLAYSADGADTHIPADSNGLAVNIKQLAGSTTGTHTAVVVGATATLLAAANTGRRTIAVRPADTIFIGYSNTVTAATGFPIYGPSDSWSDDIFKGALYAVCSSGTVNTRVLEAL